MNHRILILLSVLLLLLTATAAAQDDSVIIRWGVWGSEEELASHQAIADGFNAQHDDIEVVVEHTPWNDYHTRLATQIAAGDQASVPDVFFLAQDFGRYAESGVLEPLDSYIASSSYDLSDYWPNIIENATVNGSIYGLQRDLDMRLLYYNKTMFDTAGINYPDENWTWDDWAEAAEALTIVASNGRTEQYGLGMEYGKWGQLVLQTGGGIVDDPMNPSTCLLDEMPAMQAVTFMSDLLENGYAMRFGTLDQAGGDTRVFLEERVAMIVQNGSRAATFAEAGMDFDVAPLPIPEDGQRVNNSGGARFVMNSASENKDAAWSFLSWLQGPEGQTIYIETSEMFPALRSVANSPTYLESPDPLFDREALVIEAAHVRSMSLGSFPEWGELNDLIITPNLQSIFIGDSMPEDGVAEICAGVENFLEQNGYPRSE